MMSLWTWVGFAAWLAGTAPSDTQAVWVRHVVRDHESIAEIARRYDVTPQELLQWNDADAKTARKRIGKGDLLRIKPKLLSRPRQLTLQRVRRGDTWEAFAARFGVEVDELKRWNRKYAKRKQPPRRARLVVWSPSGVDPSRPEPEALPELPPVPADAYSIGLPQRGRLNYGVPLPESDLYTIRFPRLAYGSSLAVRSILQAIATFRTRTGYAQPLYIGAMSRRNGRTLPPHVSHQSGRDLDIWLPAMPWVTHQGPPDRHEVDWHATWELMRSFYDTGTIEMIFLEMRHFRRIRHAAMRLGASDDEIAAIFDKIHHSKGHVHHMHVRFTCNPNAPRCKHAPGVS